MDLRCLHCERTPEESHHKPGLDCVRFICGECVNASISHGGKPLRFPRDEQDEFLLTGNIHQAHEEVA